MTRPKALEEAILLASSPEKVREYLIARGTRSDLWDPRYVIDEDVEASLLAREDRLIDLTLAEYCESRKVAAELFGRDQSDLPIRSLILSNEVIGSPKSFHRLPNCLFEDEKNNFHIFLKNINGHETWMLFSNPTISWDFLWDFLSAGDYWEMMPEEHRLAALHYLGTNPQLIKRRGFLSHAAINDDCNAERASYAAFSLIAKLDPNLNTAMKLSELLRNLPAVAPDVPDIASALEGWNGLTPDAEEHQMNQDNRLSPAQKVRQAGARILCNGNSDQVELYLESEDVALRCGAYEAGTFSESDVRTAFKKDGVLAAVHFARNENLWRDGKRRRFLKTFIYEEACSDEVDWELSKFEERYAEAYPHWFRREDAFVEPSNTDLEVKIVNLNAKLDRIIADGEGFVKNLVLAGWLVLGLWLVSSWLGD